MPVYVSLFQAQIYVLTEKGVQNGGQWDKDKHSHNSHQISANCHSRKHPDGGQPDRAADHMRINQISLQLLKNQKYKNKQNSLFGTYHENEKGCRCTAYECAENGNQSGKRNQDSD